MKVETFGSLLKHLRSLHGISQRKLAASIGISPGHLSRIESGKKNPPKRETIERICHVLNLDSEQREQIYNTAGLLVPEEKETSNEIPGFHSPLYPRKNILQSQTQEPQLKGQARKAVEQITELLSRKDLDSKQRRKLAKELITFTEFLETKISTDPGAKKK